MARLVAIVSASRLLMTMWTSCLYDWCNGQSENSSCWPIPESLFTG